MKFPLFLWQLQGNLHFAPQRFQETVVIHFSMSRQPRQRCLHWLWSKCREQKDLLLVQYNQASWATSSDESKQAVLNIWMRNDTNRGSVRWRGSNTSNRIKVWAQRGRKIRSKRCALWTCRWECVWGSGFTHVVGTYVCLVALWGPVFLMGTKRRTIKLSMKMPFNVRMGLRKWFGKRSLWPT